MSIVAIRSANLRKCGLNTCHGGMLPLFPSTDGTLPQNPHFAIPGTEPPKITTVLLQCGIFHGKSGSCGHTLNTRRSLKTIGNLWCREGESNPQGTIPADFEFHCGF